MVDITRTGNTSSKNVTPNEPKGRIIFRMIFLRIFENLSRLSLEIYLLMKNLHFLNVHLLTENTECHRKCNFWAKFPSEMTRLLLENVLF